MSIGGRVYHEHTIVPIDPSRSPRVTLRSYTAGPVTLGTIHYSAGARVTTGSVHEGYQINLPLEGTVRTSRPGERAVLTVGSAAAYGLHQHAFEGFETPATLLGLKIERIALERRLAQLLGRDLGGEHVEFDLRFDLGEPRAQEWMALLRVLLRRLHTEDSLSSHPTFVAQLHDALLTGLLLAAPHAFRDELDAPTRAATPRAVRRVLALIDASPDATLLTVPELAAHAGVSVRTLQAGFRAALDTTPLAYLRARRLEATRRELAAADPATTRVGEVADRWGFAHHGRFASEYRDRFGESPAHTLSRS